MTSIRSPKSRLPRLGLWVVLCLVSFVFLGNSPLKYTEDRTPSALNPLFADDMYSVRASELLFESLIGWDKEQKPSPMLATSWQISSDNLTIILNLREGVKWHDGKPFTSADVVFTIQAMTNKKSQITDRYLAQIIKSVDAPSPSQARIEFKKPLSSPLRWLQFKLLPAHRFPGGTILRSNYFSQKPLGTGPFAFKAWKGRKIEFRRFKDHWRKTDVLLKGVDLQAIPDKNIQSAVLRYGGLDAIIRVRPKDIPLFERDQNVRLYPYSTNDWWYIALNHQAKNPLQDLRLRQALVYALDREGLRSAHLGDGQIISGPFSPNDPLYNFSIEPRTQDTDKAKQLLDSAGWKESTQGTRKKGGKELSLRLLLARSKSSYNELCLALQGELSKVGIKIDLVWLDDAAWDQAVFQKKDFDLALHIWNFDDLASIYPLFHSKGSRNYISYKNKDADKLLDQASSTTDPVIYKAIHAKLHKVLHDDLPYLFLWSLTNYSALSARVKRVAIHPFNYFHYAYGWQK